MFLAPCDSTLVARQMSAVLTSPGWPLGYANDVTCEWVIRGQEGYEVVLELDAVDLENCCDFVRVSWQSDTCCLKGNDGSF